jgi:hypothetical protein
VHHAHVLLCYCVTSLLSVAAVMVLFLQVYVDCDPDAHLCKTNPEAEAADEERNIPAELEAMFSS